MLNNEWLVTKIWKFTNINTGYTRYWIIASDNSEGFWNKKVHFECHNPNIEKAENKMIRIKKLQIKRGWENTLIKTENQAEKKYGNAWCNILFIADWEIIGETPILEKTIDSTAKPEIIERKFDWEDEL